MKCPKCGIDYHVCECGVAHGCGSSNAEHFMNCPARQKHTQELKIRLGWTGAEAAPMRGLFAPHEGDKYPAWECPADAGVCPWCWHKTHRGKDNTRLSEFGQKAHDAMFGGSDGTQRDR